MTATASPQTIATIAALTYRDSELLRHGRPHRMLAGALHYFRVHPAQWEDRLRRLAAMGANTVDTYVPWNFHEEVEGAPRFDGWRDVEAFIRLAGEVGLDVYVRPSPYICAEWSNGGLPVWLTARTSALRTSDPVYERAVAAWYAELLPRLAPLQAAHGGPIVAVQIENEYGSFGSDRAHLEQLRELLLEHGIVELLTTADGTQPDMVAQGSVAGAMPSFTFGTGVAEAQRLLPADTPLLCSELWGGWFDHWGERHHVRSAGSMIATVDELLAAGGSVSMYMVHGGTNFGLWNGANWDGRLQPTTTSYDSDAPIAEDGCLGAKFDALRRSFTPFHDGPLPEVPPAPSFQPAQRAVLHPQTSLLGLVCALPAGPVLAQPASFEELGLADGIVVYESEVELPAGETMLTIDGLHDRATVFLDGARLAVLDRDGETAAMIDGPARTATLTIVVESLGRVNYGRKLGEHKGILGGVLLGRRFAHGWTHRIMPLDTDRMAGAETAQPDAALPVAMTDGVQPAGGVPAEASTAPDGTAVAVFDVAEPADAWLAIPGGAKGFVWLNGFLLGRYWSVGPQETLYAPAPLWRAGRNEVRVLELDRMGEAVEIRDRAVLGEPEEFIGS